MTATVLVTGGTGYIGGEVIDRLLARDYTVHTTVRNKAKSEPKLRSRWADAGERLKVFQADLLSDEGWAEANAGCSAVAHVASPFPLRVPKNKDELIIPAREGTLRALEFATAAVPKGSFRPAVQRRSPMGSRTRIISPISTGRILPQGSRPISRARRWLNARRATGWPSMRRT